LPHKVFKRQGADLFVEKKISVAESLTGFSFVLEHLDGEKLVISSTPGEMTEPRKTNLAIFKIT